MRRRTSRRWRETQIFVSSRPGKFPTSTVCPVPSTISYRPLFYLAARFQDDFEKAVLHAINGGGQNQSRAMLTGALVGAQVGVAGIPQRFLNDLERADELQKLAHTLAFQMPG